MQIEYIDKVYSDNSHGDSVLFVQLCAYWNVTGEIKARG